MGQPRTTMKTTATKTATIYVAQCKTFDGSIEVKCAHETQEKAYAFINLICSVSDGKCVGFVTDEQVTSDIEFWDLFDCGILPNGEVVTEDSKKPDNIAIASYKRCAHLWA